MNSLNNVHSPCQASPTPAIPASRRVGRTGNSLLSQSSTQHQISFLIQKNFEKTVLFYSTSNNLTQSHPVSPSLIQSNSLPPSHTVSHPVSSSLTQSHPVSPSLTQSHPISPSLTQSHHVSPGLTQSHPVSPSLTKSHPVSPNFAIRLLKRILTFLQYQDGKIVQLLYTIIQLYIYSSIYSFKVKNYFQD